MADATLLSCPFCAWPTPFVFNSKDEPYWVECPDCCCEGPIEDSPEEAAKAWNTRQPQVPAEDVELLGMVIAKALAISHGLSPERAEIPAILNGWVRDGITAAKTALTALQVTEGGKS